MNITLERIDDLIRKKGLKVTAVKKAIGASPSTWTTWHKKDQVPGTKFIIELAKYLHCSTDYLLGVSSDTAGDLKPREKVLLLATEKLSDDEVWAVLQIIYNLPSEVELRNSSVAYDDYRKKLNTLQEVLIEEHKGDDIDDEAEEF